MNCDLILKILPYKIPKEIILKLESCSNLSNQLHCIRDWIHFNDDITHEKRLLLHKPILKLAKDYNLLENEALSLSKMVKIHDRLGNFKKSLEIIKKVKNIWYKLSLENKKYNHNLIISYCDHAVTLRLENKIDLALKTLYEGYELLKDNGLDNKEPLIILLLDLGVIYKEIMDYPAALNSFTETLKLIKGSNDSIKYREYKILSHINIANVYKSSKKLELASKEYMKAIELSMKNNYTQHSIIANINLGQTLVELKKYKKALTVYEFAKSLCAQSGSEMDLGFIYILIAEIYFSISNDFKFNEFIKKGSRIVNRLGYHNDVLFLNNLLYKYYSFKGKNQKGISLLLKSEQICIKHKINQHLSEIYKILSEAFSSINDLENAFKYSQKYIEHRDVLDNRLHQLYLNEKQQSLNRMQGEINSIKEKEDKKMLNLELQFKKRELISKQLHSISNRDFLERMSNALHDVIGLDPKVKNIIQDCQKEISKTSSWNDYLDTYEKIDPKFMQSLRKISDQLSITEIRVCSLIHLGLDNFEIAQFMSISKRSIEQHRYRIKKKLNINENLTEYILSIS